MSSLPYGRHSIDDADIEAVANVLRSDWLTCGPKVEELEEALAAYLGARHVVAVNSGTAALHGAMRAIEIHPGDEVIVPALTFVATANAVLYEQGIPVFADVLPGSLLLDPADVARKITARTRAIISVDYSGDACDYVALRALADRHGLALVADSCHALGGSYRGSKIGTIADLTCFSLHPVKPMTSGEGGLVATDKPWYQQRIKSFRNHGIDRDVRQRMKAGSWDYAMTELGFNYRLNDLQAALAISQLRKLDQWTARRRTIARRYDRLLAGCRFARPISRTKTDEHAFHLYVVRWQAEQCGMGRDAALRWLRRESIGVNIHYRPVYLHPYYQNRLQCPAGLCPIAEQAYGDIMSLPIFPAMTDEQVELVVEKMAACQQWAKIA
jgi:perosamine synthetase